MCRMLDKSKIIALFLAVSAVFFCFFGCFGGENGGEASETGDSSPIFIDKATLGIADPDDDTSDLTDEGEEASSASHSSETDTESEDTSATESDQSTPEATEPQETASNATSDDETEPKETVTTTEKDTTAPKETTTVKDTTAEKDTTSKKETTTAKETTKPAETTSSSVSDGIQNEADKLPDSPAIPSSATVIPSGVLVKSNDDAVIDYSNTADGYVMVKYNNDPDKRLKVQVKGPKTTYTYNLTPEKWEAFPLSDENGSYKITVYINASGTKYASVISLTIDVELSDAFAPFIRSNQYVNFDDAPNTVKKAAQLCGGLEPLDKVKAVYQFVVNNFKYDTKLASTVKSGYLPELDKVLEKKKGICFDYAAMMAGMLRSQGVPCKLIVGYAGSEYHAWINVWSEKTGWIEGVVYFDGTTWSRMDPTFASSGNQSSSIMDYINNDANYTVKYIY